MKDYPIPAHGGELVDLMASQERSRELKEASKEWPSWDLSTRQIKDLELLLNGGFSPLRGFMKQDDYERVVSEMRLTSGHVWPIPVVLDLPEKLADELSTGDLLALRDPEGARTDETFGALPVSEPAV